MRSEAYHSPCIICSDFGSTQPTRPVIEITGRIGGLVIAPACHGGAAAARRGTLRDRGPCGQQAATPFSVIRTLQKRGLPGLQAVAAGAIDPLDAAASSGGGSVPGAD